MNKRGAYFFVIDALIAASIIFVSLIIIFSTHSIVPESNTALRMVEDYADFLANTRVRQFEGTYTQSLVQNGNITNLDNTLLEQLTEFYYYNASGIRDTTQIMWNFTEELSKGAVVRQNSVLVYLNKSLIYNRTMTDMGKSNLLLSTKRISFKRINDTYVYGPITLEVRIWV